MLQMKLFIFRCSISYDEHVIEALSYPIQNGDADFVKSSFNRTTGGKVSK